MDGNPSLRREENGPWRISGYIAAAPSAATNGTETAVAAPAREAGRPAIFWRNS